VEVAVIRFVAIHQLRVRAPWAFEAVAQQEMRALVK